MPKTYTYTQEQLSELESTYNKTRNRRVQIVMMRAQGISVPQVMAATKCGSTMITLVTKKYLEEGIESLLTTKYTSHNRYLSFDEETEFLAQFLEKADLGQIITVKEMHQAYQDRLGKKTAITSFYYLLKRHGWRKLMPRPHHPKQADAETIEASKKLTTKSKA